MTDQEILLVLNAISGLGSITLKKLIAKFSPLEKVFKAAKKEFKDIPYIKEKTIEKIINWEQHFDLKKEINLIKREKIKVLNLFDQSYPRLLKEIYSPPLVLYVKGNLQALRKRSIGIVGSRRASFYGIKNTQKLARELAVYDIGIVSGLALGIDTAAHKGALEGKGTTISVLGNGLSTVYPRENKKLAQAIMENKGALISEYPLSTPPLRQNFPQRNRIICGLSEGIMVTEAAKKSGALITADFALEEGRTVFSMPGKIDALSSAGTNWLIKQGAKLITSSDDILEELAGVKLLPKQSKEEEKAEQIPPLNPKEEAVYKSLDGTERTIDEIKTKINLPVSTVISSLLSLELKKLIKQLPGKKYIKF